VERENYVYYGVQKLNNANARVYTIGLKSIYKVGLGKLF
jgi:hypothetical protein